MNVSLSPLFEEYIQVQLNSGKYNNASEVIREALRLKMQEEEIYQAKLQSLKTAINDGVNSGEPVEWNAKDFLNSMRDNIDEK